MKVKDVILDGCTVAGCSLGVGFLCGKEAQVFVGNFANTAIFASCFFVSTLLVRNFCLQKRSFCTESFCNVCFGGAKSIFYALFCACCFVCAVTALSALQHCLQSFLFQTSLPFFSVVAALISAAVLKSGMKTLKILNVISVALSLLYVVFVAICAKNPCKQLYVAPSKSVKYAFFSVTVSLAVLAPLSKTSAKQNFWATLLATAILGGLTCAIICFADFSLQTPFFVPNSLPLKIFGAITLLIATVTGVVANALPVVQIAVGIVEDKTLGVLCVFCLAVAFSTFGFDFILDYGYLFVAAVGVCVTISAAAQLLAKRLRRKTAPKIIPVRFLGNDV